MNQERPNAPGGMRQLSRTETYIYLAGAILMVVGSGAHVLLQPWGAYLFAIGSIAFALMQMKQTYDGRNVALRRLRRIMVASDVFFLVAAVLMFAGRGNPFGLPQIAYVEWVMNKWVVAVLVAAVLQLYASHRISSELAKERE